MFLANTGRINKKIAKIIDSETINSQVAHAFECFNMHDMAFCDFISVNEQARKFKELMHANGYDYTDDEALVGSMLGKIIVQNQAPIPEKAMNAAIKASHVFHRGEVESDPYLQNVKPGQHTVGRFTVDETSIAKYELMGYTEAAVVDGILVPKLGVFDHKFIYPYIKEGENKVWMSITPNEISTMAEPIEHACGKVLMLGLGMGYFAYMTAGKDDVERVTIVERDPDVIELFNKYIYPQFGCKEKITVLEADAFDFLSVLEDGVFDYCFADLWQGGDDLLPYIECRRECARFEKMNVEYWIDNAMRTMFSACIKASILGAYFQNMNNKDWHVVEPPPCMEKYTANIEIKSAEDVDFYTDMNNIDAIIAKTV